MQDGEPFRREVPCLDTADRPRLFVVFVTAEGRIAFQCPPGEVAQLLPSDINDFQAIVTEAQIKAMTVRRS
jgi:hypothetical protein